MPPSPNPCVTSRRPSSLIREEVVFTDGWHVPGLRGTGSHDYNVAGAFVPAHRTLELFTRGPLRAGSAAGRMGLMADAAAVWLGIVEDQFSL
jgi:indole-3-acetate monooxygenase